MQTLQGLSFVYIVLLVLSVFGDLPESKNGSLPVYYSSGSQKLAGDKQLEVDASEARLRSERRLGELMKGMPKSKGTRSQLSGRNSSGGACVAPPEESEPTLDSLGINKNLAKSARVAGRRPNRSPSQRLTPSDTPLGVLVLCRNDARHTPSTGYRCRGCILRGGDISGVYRVQLGTKDTDGIVGLLNRS